MAVDDKREAFEAHAKKTGYLEIDKLPSGQYRMFASEDQWKGWQARGEHDAAKRTVARNPDDINATVNGESMACGKSDCTAMRAELAEAKRWVEELLSAFAGVTIARNEHQAIDGKLSYTFTVGMTETQYNVLFRALSNNKGGE